MPTFDGFREIGELIDTATAHKIGGGAVAANVRAVILR